MIRDVNLGSGSATLVLLLSGFDFGFMFWRFFTFWEPFAFIGKMHYLILSFQRDSKEWMVLSPMAATIWSKVCVVVYSYWIVCTHSIGYGTGTVVKRLCTQTMILYLSWASRIKDSLIRHYIFVSRDFSLNTFLLSNISISCALFFARRKSQVT